MRQLTHEWLVDILHDDLPYTMLQTFLQSQNLTGAFIRRFLIW